MNSGYKDFARYYDILNEAFANKNTYANRTAFYHALIEKHTEKHAVQTGQTEQKILLDLACGTGGMAEEFAKLGYDVIGVDSSVDMLNIAMQKKAESGLNIQYLCQDMTELDMFGTVDVTVCAADGLNHLPDFESVEKTLTKVSLFSSQGALFLFDMNTPYLTKNIIADNTFVTETDNVFFSWRNDLAYDGKSVRFILDFFELQEDGSYLRYEEDFAEQVYSIKEIDKLAKKCGFKILGKYSHFSLEKYDKTKGNIVYVTRKI